MTNSVDPDQLASSEANWSGSTLFAKAGYIYPGSAGQGLNFSRYKAYIFIATCTLLLEGRQIVNSKPRVCCISFIHDSDNSNVLHIARSLWTHPLLTTSMLICPSMLGTCRRHVRDTPRLWAMPHCASRSMLLMPKACPQLALNMFNITMTRQNKVCLSKVSNQSQHVGTLSFFSKSAAQSTSGSYPNAWQPH